MSTRTLLRCRHVWPWLDEFGGVILRPFSLSRLTVVMDKTGRLVQPETLHCCSISLLITINPRDEVKILLVEGLLFCADSFVVLSDLI